MRPTRAIAAPQDPCTGLKDSTGVLIPLGARVGVVEPIPSEDRPRCYGAVVEGTGEDDIGPYLVLRTSRGDRSYTRPKWVTVVGLGAPESSRPRVARLVRTRRGAAAMRGRS